MDHNRINAPSHRIKVTKHKSMYDVHRAKKGDDESGIRTHAPEDQITGDKPLKWTSNVLVLSLAP